jgi:hypothetical protein
MATADPDDASILAAVAAERDAIVELLTDLVEAPTVLGDEELGQVVMERGMRDAGLEPVDVPMDAETLRAHPACAASATWSRAGAAARADRCC